jgi:hypothetical protein
MKKQVQEEKIIFEFTNKEIEQLFHEIKAIDIDSNYQVEQYELLSKLWDAVTPNYFSGK